MKQSSVPDQLGILRRTTSVFVSYPPTYVHTYAHTYVRTYAHTFVGWSNLGVNCIKSPHERVYVCIVFTYVRIYVRTYVCL